MKTLTTLLLTLLVLVGCATPVTYDRYILQPSESANSSSPIGFGPFKEALESLSQSYKIGQIEQHVHITPTIPLTKEKAFRDCYKELPDDEPIFALIDSSLSMSNSGKGCTGFVFTSKGIHSNPGSFAEKSGKSFIPYSTLYSSNTYFSAKSFGVNINDNVQLHKPVNMEENQLLSVMLSARKARYSSKTFEFTDAELQLSNIPEDLLTFSEQYKNEGIFISKEIPSNKESSFRACSNLDKSIEIFVLIDATFFGGGNCVGMAFLETGIIINNSWLSMYPGTYFLSYDYLLNSDFVPYLCDVNNCSNGANDAFGLYLDKNFSFDISGMGGDFMETGSELVEMFKQLKNTDSVSNEEAILIANTFKKLPIYSQRVLASSSNRKSSNRQRPTKIKKEVSVKKPQTRNVNNNSSESFLYSFLKRVAIGVADELAKNAVNKALGIKECIPGWEVTNKSKSIPQYDFNSGKWKSKLKINTKRVYRECT